MTPPGSSCFQIIIGNKSKKLQTFFKCEKYLHKELNTVVLLIKTVLIVHIFELKKHFLLKPFFIKVTLLRSDSFHLKRQNNISIMDNKQAKTQTIYKKKRTITNKAFLWVKYVTYYYSHNLIIQTLYYIQWCEKVFAPFLISFFF